MIIELVRFLPKPKESNKRNLLSTVEETETEKVDNDASNQLEKPSIDDIEEDFGDDAAVTVNEQNVISFFVL